MDATKPKAGRERGLPRLWTVEALAEHWRIRPDTLRAWARRGDLPSIKLGRKVLFPEDALRAKIEGAIR